LLAADIEREGRAVIDRLMRGTGTALLPVAGWLIWVRGAGYSFCTGLYVNSLPPDCQKAAGARYLGIVLAMTGGLLNVVSVIPARPLPPARREAHDSVSRIDQYLVAPYFSDLPDLIKGHIESPGWHSLESGYNAYGTVTS
jgi:hypothetical protein